MKKNTEKLFFKCTRWQVEETTDLVNCPYHYFCDSPYEGDYPPAVDLSVLLFTVSCFLSATVFTLVELGCSRSSLDVSNGRRWRRRYLLPSGPIALPLLVLIFANGRRIDTVFPLTHIGPALLQLAYVSALAFRNRAATDIKVFFLRPLCIMCVPEGGIGTRRKPDWLQRMVQDYSVDSHCSVFQDGLQDLWRRKAELGD
ncbi:hypothetical protein B296_00027082 [Ensete ventricosum]|uniref:Uncharacterized protein n=1 Tax=Ensete ventricosum TaxID=4639 RepID=A0A426YZZ3_ENSVE|nr:hypothetical protein B296_00027082 [Ensete ventricosum]